jgi:hypothetical protein
MIRYTKEIQDSVVQGIIRGELLVEEAMIKHGIMSKRTIIRWLRRYQKSKCKAGQ